MAIQKSGFVALLDVLGFSDRVTRGALAGLDGYIDTVVRVTKRFDGIGTILFSDTVVLYTFDDGPSAFDAIISVSSALLYALIDANVPVRGAISHGMFLRSDDDRHGTVLAGRPIIDAHHYESRLQWIGIMFTPSVLEHRPDFSAAQCSLDEAAAKADREQRALSALSNLMIQPCKAIPLEDDDGEATTFEGFAVVPIGAPNKTIIDLRDSLSRSRQRLERLKQLAPDVRSQAKYQRSIMWLQELRTDLTRAFSNTGDLSR